jgi:hypothetical protein
MPEIYLRLIWDDPDVSEDDVLASMDDVPAEVHMAGFITDEMVEKGAGAIHGGKGCTCRAGARGDARAVLVAALKPKEKR